MEAITFWEKFNKHICHNPELVAAWNYPKMFTNIIMDTLEHQVLGNSNLKTEREYFRIDLIGYESNASSTLLTGNLQKYSWNLKVAVEHENDYRLWVDEVVKLAHIVCPLRVVIGYLPKNKKYDHQSVFSEVTKNLKEVAAWESSSKVGEFLLIIGDCKVEEKTDRCVYTPYRYNPKTDAFEPLQK